MSSDQRDAVVLDTLTILSHMARCSVDHVLFVSSVLKGDRGGWMHASLFVAELDVASAMFPSGCVSIHSCDCLHLS